MSLVAHLSEIIVFLAVCLWAGPFVSVWDHGSIVIIYHGGEPSQRFQSWGAPVLINNNGNSVMLKRPSWSLFFPLFAPLPDWFAAPFNMHTLLSTSVSIVMAVWFLTILGQRSHFVTVFLTIRLLTGESFQWLEAGHCLQVLQTHIIT